MLSLIRSVSSETCGWERLDPLVETVLSSELVEDANDVLVCVADLQDFLGKLLALGSTDIVQEADVIGLKLEVTSSNLISSDVLASISPACIEDVEGLGDGILGVGSLFFSWSICEEGLDEALSGVGVGEDIDGVV